MHNSETTAEYVLCQPSGWHVSAMQ